MIGIFFSVRRVFWTHLSNTLPKSDFSERLPKNIIQVPTFPFPAIVFQTWI